MFKPARMGRTVIIGPREYMEMTVETLHAMGCAHIIDYVPDGTETELKLGAPTVKASEASGKLLKIRSGAKLLSIAEGSPTENGAVTASSVESGLDATIQQLETEINSAAERKIKNENELRSAGDRIGQLEPFAGLGITLENYRGHGHLAVYTGTVGDAKRLLAGLGAITDEYESFIPDSPGDAFALFISKEYSEQASRLLQECGYCEIKVPEGNSLPDDIIRTEQCFSADKRREKHFDRYESGIRVEFVAEAIE